MLLAVMALAFAAATFLELGSRFYDCPDTGQPVQQVVVCNAGYDPASQGKLQSIQAIVAARLHGSEPTSDELMGAVELVNYEDMPGFNGLACSDGMIFVRNSLGRQGRYFVARHELEHIFMRNGTDPACSNPEYCATMAAVRIYPLGFLETILSSIYLSASESPTIWCFLFGSWSIFRANILPW